ncbi:probable G-protein coupled receptor [Synchiropus splendidus]|uniref:probable G-protein coupled receptor n=1 Tax=Synchiropus splendidus TaxID=270530 RepID=UPI00237E4A80|nr:probable G-protein coupled receptor [Synchiropus splendidus]
MMEANTSTSSLQHASSSALAALLPSAPGRHVNTLADKHVKHLVGVFFQVTLNVLALVANTAVLLAVVKAPHLRKFVFVCHLCAVDLLCAVLLMPLGIVSSSLYFADVVFTILQCQIYLFLKVLLMAASIFTITAISVERYYYIVHPMHYEVKMTLRLTAAVVVLVWVASVLLGLSTTFGWPACDGISAAQCSLIWSHRDHREIFSVLFSVTCFCLPAVVIFSVYCNVYKVARVAAHQHGPLPSWTHPPTKNRSDSINSHTTIITSRSAPRRMVCGHTLGGGKAALTLMLIVGQFLICWLPYFAFHIHMTIDPTSGIPEDFEDSVTWLAYSSFAINPFFYGLLNRQIREELWKLRNCYSRRPVEPAVSSHDGSGPENFLQFLHRTSCTAESGASFVTSSPRNTLDPTGFRLPGQIPEELD